MRTHSSKPSVQRVPSKRPNAYSFSSGQLEQRDAGPGELGRLARSQELGVRHQVDRAGDPAQLARLLATRLGQPDRDRGIAVEPFEHVPLGLGVTGEDELSHSSTLR